MLQRRVATLLFPRRLYFLSLWLVRSHYQGHRAGVTPLIIWKINASTARIRTPARGVAVRCPYHYTTEASYIFGIRQIYKETERSATTISLPLYDKYAGYQQSKYKLRILNYNGALIFWPCVCAHPKDYTILRRSRNFMLMFCSMNRGTGGGTRGLLSRQTCFHDGHCQKLS